MLVVWQKLPKERMRENDKENEREHVKRKIWSAAAPGNKWEERERCKEDEYIQYIKAYSKLLAGSIAYSGITATRVKINMVTNDGFGMPSESRCISEPFHSGKPLVMSHGELAMNWLMGWSKATTVRRTRDDAS